jgi:hypothetical protein
MRLDSWIWVTTAGIVAIAFATKTDIIQKFLAQVKGAGHGFYYYDDYGVGGCLGYDDPRVVNEPYPSEIKKEYIPFDYRGTEAQPRSTQSQEDEEEQSPPLVDERYPSHIEHQYVPPRPQQQHPNQNLCTGNCMQGSCDSQGFCIDSGCGSVIRGGSQCKEEKTKKKKKHHNNNIHPGEEPPPQQESPYPEPVIMPPSSSSIPIPGGGTTIYPAVSHFPISNPAGHTQSITYHSNHKHAQSHRVDVEGVGPQPNLEATVYLAWPANCTGGGHPELAIKFWGPDHTDHNCCYCFTVAIPSKDGKSLKLGFGGEGPHPTTETDQNITMAIPLISGKTYGIKGIIWQTPMGVHQETWYDDGSGGWQMAGQWDRQSCGTYTHKDSRASTSPAPNAEVEFRIDCDDVTFSGTDVAVINPPGGGGYSPYYY